MKLIGVLTEDFRVYHDVVHELRERELPFVSLALHDELPANVGVVITAPAEREHLLGFERARIVAFEDAREAVDAAMRALRGGGPSARVAVGIDPGDHPGVAVFADGVVAATMRAESPEAVPDVVRRALSNLIAERIVLRVGHGDPTKRDRILRGLVELGHAIEIVDETRSTPATYKTPADRDISAAKTIALARGLPLAAVPARPRPSEGEIRDIQRKSRIESNGEFTIARDLARRVALGRVTLEQAVRRQRIRASATAAGTSRPRGGHEKPQH